MKIEDLECETGVQTVKCFRWIIPAKDRDGQPVRLSIATSLPYGATAEVMAQTMKGAQKELDAALVMWREQGFTFEE